MTNKKKWNNQDRLKMLQHIAVMLISPSKRIVVTLNPAHLVPTLSLSLLVPYS